MHSSDVARCRKTAKAGQTAMQRGGTPLPWGPPLDGQINRSCKVNVSQRNLPPDAPHPVLEYHAITKAMSIQICSSIFSGSLLYQPVNHIVREPQRIP